MRKGKNPIQYGSGIRVNVVKKNGCTIRNLENETHYTFLVICVFKDKLGTKLLSKGINVGNSPTAPPEPVNILTLEKIGQMVDLSWFLEEELVEILVAKSPFPYRLGEFVDYGQIKKLGITLPSHKKGGASYRIMEHGIFYFLPITVKNNLAVVGITKKEIHFEEVKDFKAKVDGEVIRLNWDYPNGIEKILITYPNPDNFPEKVKIEIPNVQKEVKGVHNISLMSTDLRELIITIQTIIDTTEGRLFSEGVETFLLLKKVEVELNVSKKTMGGGIFFKKRSHEFKAIINLNGTTDIPLQLVVKEDNKLISYRDMNRTVIEEIDCFSFSNNLYDLDFTYSPKSKAVRYLFFSLIPKYAKDRNELSFKGNGIRIKL